MWVHAQHFILSATLFEAKPICEFSTELISGFLLFDFKT